MYMYITQKKKNKSKPIALALTPSSDSDSDNAIIDTLTSTSQHAADALNPKIPSVEAKSGPKKGKTTKRIEKQETIELELRAQVCILCNSQVYTRIYAYTYTLRHRVYFSTSATL